jgi:hypothetical protein
MSQLRPGARQALDHAQADLVEIIEMAYNPAAVEALARRCIRRLHEDIEPKMQRAEPVTEQRLKDIEDRLTKVETLRIVVEKAHDD